MPDRDEQQEAKERVARLARELSDYLDSCMASDTMKSSGPDSPLSEEQLQMARDMLKRIKGFNAIAREHGIGVFPEPVLRKRVMLVVAWGQCHATSHSNISIALDELEEIGKFHLNINCSACGSLTPVTPQTARVRGYTSQEIDADNGSRKGRE